jgi:4-hydroxybenzoate polyprenyltransferase
MEEIQSRGIRGRVADAPSGHWVYRLLPRPLWPYAQLARWDRSIGWWLLLWPCWWSAALAASAGARPGAELATVLPSPWHLFLFLAGAVVMRGAGCTYNDLVDENIDAGVERTRSRPLPSGQVSRRQAWAFLVLQALVGLAALVQFNWFAIIVGIASLAIVAVYPFAKRFTDWPQFFLGLAFSWGALMGWAAHFGSLSWAPVVFYAGSILWVIGYDTIYAHQDKEDDALIGVKSSARILGDATRPALYGFYGAAMLVLSDVGVAAHLGWPYFVLLSAGAAQLVWQAARVDTESPADCLAKFKSNRLFGWLVLGGIVAGKLVTV